MSFEATSANMTMAVKSMAKSAQKVYRLQLMDTELAELRSRLREVEAKLGESPELQETRRTQLQAQAALDADRARLRDWEMDLQTLNDKITATEQRLYSGRATNPKELGAMQADHEQWRRSRSKLEDDILLAMADVEEGEKTLASTSTHLAEVQARWVATQERTNKDAQVLRTKISTAAEKRSALLADVQPTDLKLYQELLLKKGGRAVVLLVEGMCQGCRVTLPKNQVQLARASQELFTCVNCGRILVVEP